MDNWICPRGCVVNHDTPFVYTASQVSFYMDEESELGVLSYPTLEPSNRWEDGTVGVPDETILGLGEGDDIPFCNECYSQAVRKP